MNAVIGNTLQTLSYHYCRPLDLELASLGSDSHLGLVVNGLESHLHYQVALLL